MSYMRLKLPFGWALLLRRKTTINATRPASASYDKVFFIGRNKTGTTTMYHTMIKLGFKVANQTVGEVLTADYMEQGRMDRLEGYIETAEVFQDVPFALPGFYKELIERYPNAKFVLTVRDSAEQWYQSVVRFQKKTALKYAEAKPPESSDLEGNETAIALKDKKRTLHDPNGLMDINYLYQGFAYDIYKHTYNYPEVPLHDEAYYKGVYNKHIEDVKADFAGQPDRLLVLNAGEPGALHDLLTFLEFSFDPKKVPANFERYKITGQ